jgi:hypothetical protein
MRLDEHCVARGGDPVDVDPEAVEVLWDSTEHALQHCLRSTERAAGPPNGVLGLVPLDVVIEDGDKGAGVALREPVVGLLHERCVVRHLHPPLSTGREERRP